MFSGGRVLDGDRCTGRGNSDSCFFGFFRRASLKSLEDDGRSEAEGVAGLFGEMSLDTRSEPSGANSLAEEGHSPPVGQILSRVSGLAVLVKDFLLLNELLRRVLVRVRLSPSVEALYEADR